MKTYVAAISVHNADRYKVGSDVPPYIYRGQKVQIPDDARVSGVFVPADSPEATALQAELDWWQKHDAAVAKALAKLGFKSYREYCQSKGGSGKGLSGAPTRQSADEKALVALLAERPPVFRPTKTIWQKLSGASAPQRPAPAPQDPFAH